MVMKMKKEMDNQEIARLLEAVAAALEIKGENHFRITAYERAAATIEHATSEVKDLWDDGKLTELPGVGASLAQHLDELFRTGRVKHFEEVTKGLPPAMFELLNVPGIGAKTAYQLCRTFKLNDPGTVVNQLIGLAQTGKIANLEGFGEKSQADLLEGLEEFKQGQGKKKRMNLPLANAIAQEVIDYLKQNSAVIRADVLGSLRRMVATIGDIDIAVAANKPAEVIDWFLGYPKKKLIEKGPSGASLLLKSGHQLDLRVVETEAYGSMLQYFTGSKHHNIHLREYALKKGFSLSEYGIKKTGKSQKAKVPGFAPIAGAGKSQKYNPKVKILKFDTERKFYNFLGMAWIPPEIREDFGEIEASLSGKLPRLVETREIKGDLHVHSDFPIEPSHDLGETPMFKMLEKAQQKGYEYLGFSEHNPSQSKHNDEQIISIIKMKRKLIDELNYSNNKNPLNKGKSKIKALNGLEIDIRPDGSLALPEKGFEYLDYAIASIHSNFKMSRTEMTKRVLKALGHPIVTILGHPTGRKLGEREGFELDWEEIFSFCQKNGKILEINAWPDRLDLPDTLVREAVKNRVKMIINTDSHAVDQMDLMFYGVSVARRGWAEAKDIVNTLPVGRLSDILHV